MTVEATRTTDADLEALLQEMESQEPAVLAAPPAVDSDSYDADADGITMSMRAWLQWKCD